MEPYIFVTMIDGLLDGLQRPASPHDPADGTLLELRPPKKSESCASRKR